MDIGKLLIVIGFIIAIVGFLLTFKFPIPFLGKLPGDLSFDVGGVQVYFPIVTCIIVSIFLSILYYLLSK